MSAMTAEARCEQLSEQFALPPGSAGRLLRLLDLLATEQSSITSVRDPQEAVEIHIADSLAGLLVPGLSDAARIADIGAGAGLPSLVLAVAHPGTEVVAIESVKGKAQFIERAATALGLANVEVQPLRAEEADSLDRFDVVTARALGSLPLVLEYAAPLLRSGGLAVAWKGEQKPAEAAAGEAAAQELGLAEPRWLEVDEGIVRGARERQLVVTEKVADTPDRYPRRPGMARKRPLGS